RPYVCMEPAGPLHNHMCNVSSGTMSLTCYGHASPVVCRQPVYMHFDSIHVSVLKNLFQFSQFLVSFTAGLCEWQK
ncbi:unnamed protein product, partial [Bubo scandiacus]